MSNQKIWLIAIGIIVVDLAIWFVPVVPFAAAYVLLTRPPWFKQFVDDLYESR